MISTGARSITSAISGLPPITANATSTALPLNKPEQPQLQHSLTGTKTTRRNAALISLIAPLVPSLCQPAPATAFSIGISGPKDWLREQKKKASKFILAPIDASRESLRTAYRLLTKNASGYPKDLEEIQNLLRSAARDCVPQERNSFVSFQANTGIEVCTFRLIVKNASSLLDNASPVKLKAEAMLDLLPHLMRQQTTWTFNWRLTDRRWQMNSWVPCTLLTNLSSLDLSYMTECM
ncbi:PREDICTED: uncharacterized protein LOC104601866 isoform X3 [Nelumbo nucifera]|uniref:Uncharacterized protein LOC104601866 isoform X3 n=1 Tax=Nelumbo nucifera TaxID=4432 RepID=A0A1U8AML6_NELNU|nr:PREDICTED: uncharacterized protein LOC104601866 isoform X3 [Nelumbo nucifera]